MAWSGLNGWFQMGDFETNGSNGSGRDTTVLVCGLCREILSGRYPDESEADLAADEHVQQEHPDRSSVIVIPVSEKLSQERRSAVVAIAAQAQAGREDDVELTTEDHRREPEMGAGEAG